MNNRETGARNHFTEEEIQFNERFRRVWDSLRAKGVEYIWEWIRKRIREYYSDHIKNNEDVDRITQVAISDLDFILGYILDDKGYETAVDFFMRCCWFLFLYDKEKQRTASPIQLAFSAAYRMKDD